MPTLTGRQTVLGFLASILPTVKGIELKQHIVEGDYVATVFDMETAAGVDHVFDRIHILDGKITRSKEYTRFTIRNQERRHRLKALGESPAGARR